MWVSYIIDKKSGVIDLKHIFIKGNGKSDITLLLLHGTGGRETDLLHVAATVDQNANVLAYRGDVLEGEQSRYFKRFDLKRFDEESLKTESEKLYNQILEDSEKYDFDLKRTVIIGYSNGANIAAHMLLNHDTEFLGAMLMHPGYFSEQVGDVNLGHMNVLLIAGARDTLTTAGEAYKLKQKLEAKGAKAEVKLTDGGHEIDMMEPMEGHVWLLGIK